MTTNSSQNLVRLEESIAETNLVAIIRQEPAEINKLHELEFNSSYDDLDYLVFTTLSLPSGNKVALVCHENSPAPGTEICVKYNQPNIAAVIQEALAEMNLSPNDLTWIDPEYEQKLNELNTVKTVNLSNWLENLIEEGWQTLEEVCSMRSSNQNIARKKIIDFGKEPTSIYLNLIVRITPKKANSLYKICISLSSLDHQSYLPLGLKLDVLLDTGDLFLTAESHKQDMGLMLNFICCLEDRFSVKITLDEENTTVNFVV